MNKFAMFIMGLGLLIAGLWVPKALSVNSLDEWFFVGDRWDHKTDARQIDGGMLLAECAIIVGSCLLLSLWMSDFEGFKPTPITTKLKTEKENIGL